MSPEIVPVQSDAKLPERADVVVIGGGIIGVSTALSLAEKGVSVALCEKGVIAGEQSSRNWGWVRKSGRDSREIPLIIESLRMWEGLNERVGAETGFRAAGILFVAKDHAAFTRMEQWVERARGYQMDSRIVTGAEISELVPGAAKRLLGGLYTPSDGRAEPQKAAPAIAEAARRKGTAILTQCAVRGVELSGGRISGVVTEKGRIACTSVVLAGGAWSRLFCQGLKLGLPQLKVLNNVCRTTPIDDGPGPTLWTPKFTLRKRLDGGYTLTSGTVSVSDIVPDSFRFLFEFLPALRVEWTDLRLRLGSRFFEELIHWRPKPLDQVSPFERVRVLDPEPVRSINERAKADLDKIFPAFAKAGIAEHWGGLIDVTPDVVPVISAVDEVPGFHIATGFSGHGFGIGPAAGRLMADIVAGDAPIVDPKAFRFSRFHDGSKPRPEPSAV